jgi:hypothetical protein
MGMKRAPVVNLTRRENYRLRSHDWLLGFEVFKRKKDIVFVDMDYFFSRKRLIAVTTANTNVRTPKAG